MNKKQSHALRGVCPVCDDDDVELYILRGRHLLAEHPHCATGERCPGSNQPPVSVGGEKDG